MPTERFPFMVDVDGENAVVACNFNGFARAREMPKEFLSTLLQVISQIKEEIVDVIRDEEFVRRLPSGDRCRPIADADLGPCVARVTAARNDEGNAEFFTSLYDEEDPSAPVLILANEQHGQIISRLQEVLT